MYERGLLEFCDRAKISEPRFESSQRAQILFQPGKVFLQGQFNQPLNASNTGALCLLACAKEPQVNLMTFAFQSRPGLKNGCRARHFSCRGGWRRNGNALGNVIEIPTGQSEAFPSLGESRPIGRRLRRLGNRFFQLRPHLDQVATCDQSLQVFTKNPDSRAKMRRYGFSRPGTDRDFESV